MIDIEIIRDNPKHVKQKVKEKGLDPKLVEELLDVDKERRKTITELEKAQAELNKRSKDIAKLHGQQKIDAINDASLYSDKVKKLKPKAQEVEEQYEKLMWQMPQLHSDESPIGKDDRENVEVRSWGEKKKYDFKLKDHISLGEDLDILDLERGVKVSGFRGYYLKNEGAMLHLALMKFAMDKMVERGYTPMVPPTIVKEFTLYGSGHFPFGREEVYQIANPGKLEDGSEEEDKFLVGTAEPSLISYHANEIIDRNDFPMRYCGFSQCYRSEVGSYGKDTKGIYRIHEFMKIEQVVLCEGDYKVSEKMHQEITKIAEDIVKELEIPYRVMEICSGDMGAGKYRMYDIESWMPARGEYGETHSSSNLGDWQARRLNIRYEDKDGNKVYPHMLNNTALASPRFIIAILENFQNKDGSVDIPKALKPYTGFGKIEKKK